MLRPKCSSCSPTRPLQLNGEYQPLLHSRTDLSHKWSLCNSAGSILQWCLYRQNLQSGYLPIFLHGSVLLRLLLSQAQLISRTGADKFVVQCHNSTIPDGGFCCDATGEGSCCNSANNQLDLKPSVSSTVAIMATGTSGTVIHTTNTMNGVNSISSSTGPLSNWQITSFETETVANGTYTQLVPSTVTSTLISASSTPKTLGYTIPKQKKGFTVNDYISLGVCLGVALLASVAFLVWRLIKRRRASRHQPSTSTAEMGGPPNSPNGPPAVELSEMLAPIQELPEHSPHRESAVSNMNGSGAPIHRHPSRHETTDPFQTPSSSTAEPRPSPPPLPPRAAPSPMDGTTTPPPTMASEPSQGEGSSVQAKSPPPPSVVMPRSILKKARSD